MSTVSAQPSQSSFVARNWRDLIRPRKLEVEAETLTPFYGKFSCEPLERGFGITLGNGLRRVLLSSLQGAAITAVKIEGALHEFTTLPNVVEDVTDIILNLKEVVVRVHDNKPRTLRLEKDGEGRVTAAAIQMVDGVEVLNPDHVLFDCSKGAKVRMELEVGTGRGYVPAERNKAGQPPVGVVPIDASFPPNPQGHLPVPNGPGGQEARHGRPSLGVVANGPVRPEDAIAYAAKIFKD